MHRGGLSLGGCCYAAAVAATVVTVVGLTARVGGDSGSVAAASKAQPTAVVKAGRPAIYTSNGALVVR